MKVQIHKLDQDADNFQRNSDMNESKEGEIEFSNEFVDLKSDANELHGNKDIIRNIDHERAGNQGKDKESIHHCPNREELTSNGSSNLETERKATGSSINSTKEESPQNESETQNKENIPELIHQDSNKEKKLNNQKELSNNGKGPLGMKTKDIVAISSSASLTSLNVEQPTSTSSDEQIELGILGDRKDEEAKKIEKLGDRYFLVFVKSINFLE